MVWHTIRSVGVIYQEVSSGTKAIHTSVWITRMTLADKYNVFFCDGKNKAIGNCGSQKGARWLAADFVQRFGG